MKKYWTLFVAALVALSSCQNENKEPEAPKAVFTITSEKTLNFDAEGGEGVVTYAIENPTATGIVEASVQADWVSEVRTQSYGEITVVVDVNVEEQERTATLTLTYEGIVETVALVQAAGYAGVGNDFVREASQIVGFYYGCYFSDDPNYFIHLTNVGFDAEGAARPNGWFYTIDCYSVVEPSGSQIRVPEGVYEVDVMSSCAPNTINISYSAYFTTDEDGQTLDELGIESGTMTVTEDRIVLNITDEQGQTHYVTYEIGDYSLSDATGSQDPDEPEIDPDFGNSNLTETIELNTRYWMSAGYYYGDYYGVGYGNWMITFFPQTGNGDRITLDFVGPGLGADTDLSGIYTCSEGAESMTFAPGFYSEGYVIGSWYLQLDGGYVDFEGLRAPLVDGSFELTKNEDGTYNLVMELYDNAETPNLISGSWTGTLDFQDVSSAPARQSMNKQVSKKVRSI